MCVGRESVYVGGRERGENVGWVGKHNDLANCILEVFDNFDHNFVVGILDSMWVFQCYSEEIAVVKNYLLVSA